MAPIHGAAYRGDVEALRRLLAEGVSPDATDDRAQTPLHCLCRSTYNGGTYNGGAYNGVLCVKLLIEAGADLEAVDRDGYTPLHLCPARTTNFQIVSLLVEAGANVNAVNNYGSTALHYAYANCDAVYLVELLLAAGASVNVRNASGRTPFDTVLDWDRRRTWPLFLRAGAEIPTNITDPYLIRVRNAGGWKKYEQQHLARITSILAPTPLLPPELVRHVVSFWLHAGYY